MVLIQKRMSYRVYLHRHNSSKLILLTNVDLNKIAYKYPHGLQLPTML